MYKLTIPIEPVAKGRPKFSVRGKFVKTYTPKKTRVFESELKEYILEHYKEKLIENIPIKLTVDFYRSIPKSFSKKNTLLAEEKKIRPLSKPDLDNYIKTLDFLNETILKDDNIICEIHANKYYSIEPRIEIIIEEIIYNESPSSK